MKTEQTKYFSFFKSIIDQDHNSIVICNLEHEIIYMNPCAIKKYAKHGESLIGKSIFECHNTESKEKIEKVVNWFLESTNHQIIHTFYNQAQNKDVYMVALRDENETLIGYYEKHELRNPETMKLYDFQTQ